MASAASEWMDPETSKPYPGQRVLAAYVRRTSPSGQVSYAYELVHYESHDRWSVPDAIRERPHLWASIMEPGK